MPQQLLTRRGLVLGSLGGLIARPATAGVLEIAAIITRLTNDARRANGLPPVTRSPKLAATAMAYATVLSQSPIFGHDVGGTRMTDRVKASGYRFSRLSENLAWSTRGTSDQDRATRFVKDWLTSAGHRRNILDRLVRDTGVGVARRGQRVYVVQMFGSKR